MIEKVKITSHEQWLKERQSSIGGSEIGAVLGLNKWSTPYTVWARKLGKLPEASQNEAMRQGTDLEDYVAKRFSEASGLKVARCNYLMRNTEYPHLHATIDRRIVGMNAGLECKTASAYNADKFTDTEFPSSYYAQCVSYMAVCGFEEYFLAAVVLGPGPFKVYHLTTKKNQEKPEFCAASVYVSKDEFNAIKNVAADFWSYVDSETAPPIDGEEATTKALNFIYAEAAPGTDVDLFGTEDTCRKIGEIDEQIKSLEKERDALKNELRENLGESETGHNTEYTVSWKMQTSNRFQTKEFQKDHPSVNLEPYYKTSTSRVLRIKAQKK